MGIFNMILGISLIQSVLYQKSSLFRELNVILICNTFRSIQISSKSLYETVLFAHTKPNFIL